MDDIASFMEVAIQHVNEINETRFPCKKCLNTQWHALQTVHAHLWEYEMFAVYHTWIYYRENFEKPRQDATLPNGVEALGPNDITYEILNDAFPRDMNQDLHGECDTFGGNEGVGEREDDGTNVHRVAANKYEKLMVKAERELFSGYENIDACVNDCALFYKEQVGKDKCPECDEPRYKSTSQMRWHFDKRVDEFSVMRNPSDSIAWKEFNRMYPEFA
ncbi:hypothetical protein L3X38_043318 [Prunus dulcis]|uniref:Transposase-associated domain-containing protein n=1 Tax=Prunus dulcis TaxID=3755 RepID=A0AAD4UY84_PRUDU|nr:hypothetical protein L3X38_043318 [Prunus dulcis]